MKLLRVSSGVASKNKLFRAETLLSSAWHEKEEKEGREGEAQRNREKGVGRLSIVVPASVMFGEEEGMLFASLARGG